MDALRLSSADHIKPRKETIRSKYCGLIRTHNVSVRFITSFPPFRCVQRLSSFVPSSRPLINRSTNEIYFDSSDNFFLFVLPQSLSHLARVLDTPKRLDAIGEPKADVWKKMLHFYYL